MSVKWEVLATLMPPVSTLLEDSNASVMPDSPVTAWFATISTNATPKLNNVTPMQAALTTLEVEAEACFTPDA